MAARDDFPDDDPLWYKNAVIYELHIRSFYDSDADGIGDFQGAAEKLDYLRDLGVTALWLLPFYPSPLRDDGYDITDYFSIHPQYGDLKAFRRFLKEAHKRRIRVITEMVLNHTSDTHPWFQKARRSKPHSTWRDFYVWSDTPEKYKDARIIFKDFETSNWTWDPVAGSYFWHRFYSHQPDLNYDNFHVQSAMIRVIDFWLDMGVDGIRLDAVPYLFEREGTNCENLPETHAFLKRLRAHVDGKYRNRMLLAEANQWPEDAAAYFGDGDSCHMAFHFPLMPRMFLAVEMEDRFPVIDILDQTPEIPQTCQWALFLRNHDELTLEMVTDEERDYMYKVYARDPKTKINLGIRRRLAPLLGNNRRKIELMFLLLFSLPGTPVVYYGDEIGMGDNHYLGDRNGVRTPMQWNPDINAGFSRSNPQELYLPVVIDPRYHYEAVNVTNQERDQSSILWWMKQTIALRKRFKAFGNGDLSVLLPGNFRVLAFLRSFQEEIVLVVANLSKYPQQVELDLAEYAGYTPEEVWSRSRFRAIDKSPYSMTLGPYDYYWFLLVREIAPACVTAEGDLPCIPARSWSRLQSDANRERMEEALPAYLSCIDRLVGSHRTIQRALILERIPIASSYLLIVRIEYNEGLPVLFLLPISRASAEVAGKFPKSMIARINTGKEDSGEESEIIYDGIHDAELREDLLAMILHKRRTRLPGGSLVFHYHKAKAPDPKGLTSRIIKISPNMAYIQFEDRFFLKLYRRLQEGANHEIEVARFLSENGFANIPAYEGGIEYRRQKCEPVSIGLLQGFVSNEGDAWTYSLDEAGRFFERVLSGKQEADHPPAIPKSLFGIDPESMPPLIRDLLRGVQLENSQLLGRRTGEMHLILSSSLHPDFVPISNTITHQRSTYQSMRVRASRTLLYLNEQIRSLPEDAQADASLLVAREKEILGRMKEAMRKRGSGMRIRVHGNYRLDQILYSGKDFFLFGFEADPEQPYEERRLKRSPIYDLASMIASIHCAAYSALFKHASARREDLAVLVPWARLLSRYLSSVFLSSYQNTAADAPFLPQEAEEFEMLLNAFLLDRMFYEIRENLDEPESLAFSVRAMVDLLNLQE